jgi:hypothetical protein
MMFTKYLSFQHTIFTFWTWILDLYHLNLGQVTGYPGHCSKTLTTQPFMITFPYHSMLIADLNRKLTLNTNTTLTAIIQWFMNHSSNTIGRTRAEYPVGWDNRLISRGTDSCFGLRGHVRRIRPCVMSTFRYVTREEMLRIVLHGAAVA